MSTIDDMRSETAADRLLLLLPVLMWVAAALICWLLVTRLLVRPLKRLERAVRLYQPGDASLDLPRKVGEAVEGLPGHIGRTTQHIDDMHSHRTSLPPGAGLISPLPRHGRGWTRATARGRVRGATGWIPPARFA